MNPADLHSDEQSDFHLRLGPMPPDVKHRLERIASVFVTLSDEEQELVTQEIEQDCR